MNRVSISYLITIMSFEVPDTVSELDAFLAAGKTHPRRNEMLGGEHRDLIEQIEATLPKLHKVDFVGQDSSVAGMWGQMARDYYGILTNGEPEPIPMKA